MYENLVVGTSLHALCNSRPGHQLNGVQVEIEDLAKEAQAEGLACIGFGKKTGRLRANPNTR